MTVESVNISIEVESPSRSEERALSDRTIQYINFSKGVLAFMLTNLPDGVHIKFYNHDKTENGVINCSYQEYFDFLKDQVRGTLEEAKRYGIKINIQ